VILLFQFPALVCYTLKDLQDVKEVSRAIQTAIASKQVGRANPILEVMYFIVFMQYGNADFLSDLVAEACGE